MRLLKLTNNRSKTFWNSNISRNIFIYWGNVFEVPNLFVNDPFITVVKTTGGFWVTTQDGWNNCYSTFEMKEELNILVEALLVERLVMREVEGQ